MTVGAPASVIDCALDRDALFTPQIAPLTPRRNRSLDNEVKRYFALFIVKKWRYALLNPAVVATTTLIRIKFYMKQQMLF